MPKVTINGMEIEVPAGTNLIRAAELSGQEIAHYCYHPGLSVAGNCRMCLVEITALSEKQPKGLPKLQIACNTVAQDGMVVESENPRVRSARRSVLEFLLINHPIDCPICDQAGECKLQEYYMDYGRYRSRVDVVDKVHKHKAVPIGSDVMLDQERCILCTRCVRFLEEVTESHELTIRERGDRCELSLARGKSVDNDYAENIVDICPVGALTSRAFRFHARVWYLESTESVCTGCATGCNIDVHSRGGSMFRVKPRANEDVNRYWMCDYGRTVFADSVGPRRLLSSLSRGVGGFVPSRFEDAALRAAEALKSAKGPVAVVGSAGLSLEEGFLLGQIAEALGGGEKIVISPRDSEFADDGVLISSDRFPNRAGLKSIGFVESETLSYRADRLLVARADPATGVDSWPGVLEAAAATVVFADTRDETLEYADEILAVGSHFEGDGTFVNRDGRVQRFRKVVDPPGGSVAGWRALAYILSALEGPTYASAEEVFAALAKDVPAIPGLDYEALGSTGRPLAVESVAGTALPAGEGVAPAPL